MGLRSLLLVLLLSLAALAQVQLQDMQRESRWLRMSAEKLYTFVPAPIGGSEWQFNPNDRNSFLKRAREFERAWDHDDATLDSTRQAYQRVRNSFDQVKLYARLNMNAQETDAIERALLRWNKLYAPAPAP